MKDRSAGPRRMLATQTSRVENLRLHRFTSRQFRNTRTIRVLLPPGYDAPENQARRYPALYLNDGQNLFERVDEFPPAHWGAAETVERLVREAQIPPLVVVGIDNGGRRRNREYMPYAEPWLQAEPEGRRYPTFLVDELVPWIEERYRLLPGPHGRGLGGSSLGGAVALYTAITRPGVFERLLLESPSLFIAGQRLLRDSLQVLRWPRKVVLGVGTNETGREASNSAAVERVRHLETTLSAAGLGPDRLRVMVEEDGTHSETAWARRLPPALRFLYAGD
ncbi:MAG TPA: alpha/beta hydrolase-fold protein [Gemmatimonadota bacterium]